VGRGNIAAGFLYHEENDDDEVRIYPSVATKPAGDSTPSDALLARDLVATDPTTLIGNSV